MEKITHNTSKEASAKTTKYDVKKIFIDESGQIISSGSQAQVGSGKTAKAMI